MQKVICLCKKSRLLRGAQCDSWVRKLICGQHGSDKSNCTLGDGENWTLTLHFFFSGARFRGEGGVLLKRVAKGSIYTK